MKPPALQAAVIEAARQLMVGVAHVEGTEWQPLADSIAALDAAPEVEPEAWECDRCSALQRRNDEHQNALGLWCKGSMRPLVAVEEA